MKSSKIDMKEFTKDAFLGGRIQVLQPKVGFRSSMEAVFLAASVPAMKNQTILELGCGAGVVLMCLNHRVPNLSLYGVEIQKKYADLAQINLDQNSNVRTYHSDIQDLPLEIKNKNFDHIITNPPFYKKNAGTRSAILDKDLSLREQLNLNEWVKISAKRLRPGGMFTIIVGTERLPDIINEAINYFGNIRVKPISSRINESSNRVIIQMTKGVNGVFSLQSPLIVHKDMAMQKNSKCFTNDVQNILEKMDEIGGFIDITDSRPLPGTEWMLITDRQAANQYGVSVTTIGTMIKLLTKGVKISDYRPDDIDDELDILLRFKNSQRNLARLEDLKIPSEKGEYIPMNIFANITTYQIL